MIRFSLLVPTRARTDRLARLLDSIATTTAQPNDLEVVLGVDEDDVESQRVTHAGLRVTKTIVPPATAMGALNAACFAASSGRFVMLLNDDVVLRTRDWDLEVGAAFAQYDDDIALVHVNDGLFGDQLCTFPFLSRRACLEVGVCPVEYQRYRIDDHIHDTYYLLARLGYRRMTYLEDVVFEHENWETDTGEMAGQVFKSADRRIYVPDQVTIARDAALFDEKLAQRKAQAVALAHLIEASRLGHLDRAHALTLEPVKDSASCRQPEVVSRRPPRTGLGFPSVTVAVVTANMLSRHAQQCLTRLKEHTSRLDLMVLDNHGAPDFCHPREMNRALRSATSDFLVLMDDDVLVEGGWLDGLLASVDNQTGLVAPIHRDVSGQISFSGVHLLEDRGGTHGHLVDMPGAPRVCQAVCSALLLIDLRKCRGLRLSEQFAKYFFDLDYSFQVWEAGYRVVCTPDAIVTHLAGATLSHTSTDSARRWNSDLHVFVREWIESGRLARLQDGVWQQDSVTATLVAVPRRIRELVESAAAAPTPRFERDLHHLQFGTQRFPWFRTALARALRTCVRECVARGDRSKADVCSRALELLKDVPRVQFGVVPILVDTHLGYNIFDCEREWLAVPPSLGVIDFRQMEEPAQPGMLRGPTLDAVRTLIDEIGPDPKAPLLVGTFGRHNLVAFGGLTYAVPQRLGPVDIATPQGRARPGIIVRTSRAAVEDALRR